MANVLIGAPIWNDVGVLYTPTFDGGSWDAGNPLTNLQSGALWRVARSTSALEAFTRLSCDLKAERAVRIVCIPKHTVSSAGQWRVVGRKSTSLFAYTAGEDLVARGATFARVPTTDVKAASFVDRAGVLRYAGENRCTYSAAFDNAAWVKTTLSVAADAVAAPDGTTTADTLTASAGNGTIIQDLGVLASAAFTFSVWLKRLTGTGNVQLTLDNGGSWTTVTVTSTWTRFSLTATVASPDVGIRLVTNADAVYAWGAQCEHGSAATGYVPTTTATNAAPRDGHWIGGERTLLLEPARTNICIRSEEFDTWTLSGVTVGANSIAAPDGTTTADTLTDDGLAAANRVTRQCTFTGDGEKCVAIYLRAGTAAATSISLRDETAAAHRHIVTVTWTAGVPTLATAGGAGTLYPVEALASGWYRILFSATGVVAANNNNIFIYPTTNVSAVAGTLYAWGAQAEDAVVPSSYIPTAAATVTRSADSCYFPFTAVPQEMTAYVKGHELELYRTDSVLRRVLHIGNSDAVSDPRFSMGKNTSNQHFAQTDDGATNVSTGGAFSSTVVRGDTIEHRTVLSSTATVLSGTSLNGATESLSSVSAASTLGVAWSQARVYLTGAFASDNGQFAYSSISIATGTKTMAEMREEQYDSGWLDAWPSGWDAETAENLNLPLLHILPEDFTARYWSVQVSDTTNTDGYIDLARLCVTGAYEPSVNFIGGAEFAHESDTTTVYADGGNAIHDTRPLRRIARFTIAGLLDAEAVGQAIRTMRQLGPRGQCVLVLRPDADADLLPETSFLAVPREMTRLEYPFALYRNAAFAFTEEL